MTKVKGFTVLVLTTLLLLAQLAGASAPGCCTDGHNTSNEAPVTHHDIEHQHADMAGDVDQQPPCEMDCCEGTSETPCAFHDCAFSLPMLASVGALHLRLAPHATDMGSSFLMVPPAPLFPLLRPPIT